MVTPIGHVELKQDRGHQLPPGLQVLHAYTTLTAGCKQISIVLWNMTDKAIFLKKGASGTCYISNVSTQEETPSELDEAAQAPKERKKVQERQDKLLEKLNLDGLSEWTPRNAAIARELLLSYHDALRSSLMSSDVQAPSSTRFALLTKNNSRSDLGVYPHLYWKKFMHP